MKVEYKSVEAASAAREELGEPLFQSTTWIDGYIGNDDTVLSIKAGGAGDLYVVDGTGRVYVQFDSADNHQVHAAARWIATFINSIES